MRITRWGEFGILCALYIANSATDKPDQDSPVGAADISETQGLPIKYAQQVLHRLRKGGIIRSIRGPHGGFKLARPPEEITLRDILIATEGHTFETICETKPLGTAQCRPQESCGLSHVWKELQGAVNTVLTKKTLKGLMDFKSNHVLVGLGSKDAIQPDMVESMEKSLA